MNMRLRRLGLHRSYHKLGCFSEKMYWVSSPCSSLLAPTFDIPQLDGAVCKPSGDDVAIGVVARHGYRHAPWLLQRGLDDGLLRHVPGVPHPHRAILAGRQCCVPVPPGRTASIPVLCSFSTFRTRRMAHDRQQNISVCSPDCPDVLGADLSVGCHWP